VTAIHEAVGILTQPLCEEREERTANDADVHGVQRRPPGGEALSTASAASIFLRRTIIDPSHHAAAQRLALFTLPTSGRRQRRSLSSPATGGELAEPPRAHSHRGSCESAGPPIRPTTETVFHELAHFRSAAWLGIHQAHGYAVGELVAELSACNRTELAFRRAIFRTMSPT